MSTDVTLDLWIEYGAWGGLYQRLPGSSWRATFVDPAVGQRYSGSDDSPWVAVAWAWREAIERRAGRHRVARNPGERPDDLVTGDWKESPRGKR